MLEVYKHLIELGIDHVDIKYDNILKMPESSESWPSHVSPWTNRPYRYRLIDFTMAKKTNQIINELEDYYEDWVTMVLDGLPTGSLYDKLDF